MKIHMNLQLFAQPANHTGATGMSAEMKTYYEKRLLDQAEPLLVHDQFGDKYPIPANNGKTIEFRKYESLPKATEPLTEGVTPNAQALTVTPMTATVKQYGGWAAITDVLQLTAIDKAETDALNNVEASAGPAASAAADAAAAGAKEKTEKAIQEVKDSAVKEVKDAAAGAAARAAQSATDAASSAAEAKKTAQDIQGYYDGVQDLVTDTLRDYTGGYYRSYDLTIPAAGWKEMAKSVGRYWYSCDVAIEGCDSSYVPMGTLTLDTAGEVEKANLATVLQTVEGGVRFYAAIPPKVNIRAFVTLFAKGTASMQQASAEEVQRMLDEIFNG